MKASFLGATIAIVLATVDARPSGHHHTQHYPGGRKHDGGKIAIFGDYGWKYVLFFKLNRFREPTCS
jgi:hypothetical protein